MDVVLVYTMATAFGTFQRFDRRAGDFGAVGYLGLFVGGHDRVDEFAVLGGEITAEIRRGPVGQGVHVLRRVGPQRRDRVGRGARHFQFGCDDGAVGQVGLHGRARERGRADEQHGRDCDGDGDPLAGRSPDPRRTVLGGRLGVTVGLFGLCGLFF